MLAMSQSYHPLESSHGSSNAPQPVPIGANTQIGAVQESNVTRFNDEVQGLSTSAGADYPALFAPVETQENEWIPGFGSMVSK